MAILDAAQATLGKAPISNTCDQVPGFRAAMAIAEGNMHKAQGYLESGKARCEFSYAGTNVNSTNMNWRCGGEAAYDVDYHLRVGLTAKNLATEICDMPPKALQKE